MTRRKSGPRSPRGKREKGRNAVNAVAAYYQARDFVTSRSPFEPGIDLAAISWNGSIMIEVKAVAHLYNLDSKDKRIIWERAQECRRKHVPYLVVQVVNSEATWWRVDGLEPSTIRNGLSLKVFEVGKDSLEARGTPREGEVPSAPPLDTSTQGKEA